MSRAQRCHWYVEKLESRKHSGKANSLWRVLEMDGTSLTGRYGVYAAAHSDAIVPTGTNPKVFFMRAAFGLKPGQAPEKFQARLFRYDHGNSLTLTKDLYLVEGAVGMPRRLLLDITDISKLSAPQHALVAASNQVIRLLTDHADDDPIFGGMTAAGSAKLYAVRNFIPKASVVTSFSSQQLIKMFYRLCQTVSAIEKSSGQKLSGLQWLRFLPYKVGGGRIKLFYYLDQAYLRGAERMLSESASVNQMQVLSRLLYLLSESTPERYLSGDGRVETLEKNALVSMHCALKGGVNPAEEVPEDLAAYQRYMGLQRQVITDYKKMERYVARLLSEHSKTKKLPYAFQRQLLESLHNDRVQKIMLVLPPKEERLAELSVRLEALKAGMREEKVGSDPYRTLFSECAALMTEHKALLREVVELQGELRSARLVRDAHLRRVDVNGEDAVRTECAINQLTEKDGVVQVPDEVCAIAKYMRDIVRELPAMHKEIVTSLKVLVEQSGCVSELSDASLLESRYKLMAMTERLQQVDPRLTRMIVKEKLFMDPLAPTAPVAVAPSDFEVREGDDSRFSP